MKMLKTMGLLVCCVSIQANASVVYEGFDYTLGSPVVGQGTGDGWDGNWAASGGVNLPVITDGLIFDLQSVSGGAAQRPSRFVTGAISRTISGDSQTTLTADGSTIWFSVLMRSIGYTGTGGDFGYALNSYGTIILGDTALTGGSGTAAAPIGANGNAIGVSFAGTPAGDNFADVRAQGVAYTNGVLIEYIDDRITVGSNTVMVVGKVEWAEAGGSNDTVTLYNVSDPAAELTTNEVFATMVVDLDQSTFNVVSIGDAQTSVFDEIRFGTSPLDVGVAPPVATGEPVMLIGYAADVLTLGATNLMYTSTNYLQYTESLTAGESWNNLDFVIGVTEASWELSTSSSTGTVFYRIEVQQ